MNSTGDLGNHTTHLSMPLKELHAGALRSRHIEGDVMSRSIMSPIKESAATALLERQRKVRTPNAALGAPAST